MTLIKVFLCCGSFLSCAFAQESSFPQPQSTTPDAIEYEANLKNDPFEPINRCVLKFNRVVDGMVLKPLSTVYRTLLPSTARVGISNSLNNLKTPVIALNMGLQGKGRNATRALGRFLVNSTLGIGGLFDIASKMGLRGETTDFDQTMAKGGVPCGPYLVLPVLGPSTPRALAGHIMEVIIDPFNRVMIHEHRRNYIYDRVGIQVIATREQSQNLIDVLESDSYMYETMRNLYMQKLKVNVDKPETTPYQGPKPSDSW